MIGQFDSLAQMPHKLGKLLRARLIGQNLVLVGLARLLEEDGKLVVLAHVGMLVKGENALPRVDAHDGVEAGCFHIQIGYNALGPV